MLEVYFYPRSPYGERPRALCMVGPSAYFYPRSPYGERLLYISRLTTAQIFLSTLSLRRATLRPSSVISPIGSFLSTLSLRRATTCPLLIGPLIFISIHALLTESDSVNFIGSESCSISIHALLTESDSERWQKLDVCIIFLSTLSLRRATRVPVKNQSQGLHFYPRSPYGERLENTLRQAVDRCISIHALLTESDRTGQSVWIPKNYFYPRSPYGERHIIGCAVNLHLNFYPRSPYGERQGEERANQSGHCISIHALLTESDHSRRSRKQRHPNFYPRSPYGERHRVPLAESTAESISIHALLTESDGFCRITAEK